MESRSPTDLDALIAQAAGLRRLAVRLVGETEADDVVQDAVAAGIGGAPADPSALRPWLVHVVRNFAAGRRRGDARRRAREVDAARREELPSAGDMVERMEVQRVVAEEVLRLDEPYRATVLALHFEGASAEDYARSLGVPSATVRSWSKRGLDALRARLDRRFGGDRAAWSACLLPLARPEAALIPLAIGGGILMKKLAVAGAVVLVAGLAWWTFADGAGNELDPVAVAEVVDLTEPLAPPARSEPTVTTAPAEIAARRVDESARPAAPVAALGRVTGRITWSPDGAPAVNVGVRLARVLENIPWGAPPQVVTDRDGRFAFEAVSPDSYSARLDRSTVTKVFQLEAGGAYDFQLAIPRAGDVVGRVLDADGVPVPGAEVFVRESNSAWTRRFAFAGADGGFRFEGADRWAAFFARAPGHAPSGMRQSVDGPPRTMDLYLGGTPGRITGVVLDPRGEPRAGALVVVDPQGATAHDAGGNLLMRSASCELRTDAAGRFELLDADVGPNTLRVVVAGFPFLDASVVVRPGRSSEVVFRLPEVTRVRGRVTDVEGRAVEGARIEAQTTGMHAWTAVATGPDGRFDTGCIAAGPVRLLAIHKDGATAALDTTLAPGADFDWSPALVLLVLRGRLVDLAGTPLAGQTVTLSVKKRTATTGDDGRFVFDGLRSQDYSVDYSVTFADGDLSARSGSVVPGGPEIVMVAERADARIVGRVVGSGGRALAGVPVECDREKSTTGADGTFEFANVRSGTCEVTARLPKMIFFWLATVDVLPGAMHDVGDVVVPDTGSLHVRARSEEGVPVGWASPTLGRVGPRDQWVTLRGWGPDGIWNVEDLPAGEYELGVRDGGAAMQRRIVTIRAGERTEVDLDLRFGTVVEVEARVAPGSGPFTVIVFEFGDAAGVVVGTRGIRNASGATSTTEWAALAPGVYECSARTGDGRTGSVRIDVGPDGAAPTRIDLR